MKNQPNPNQPAAAEERPVNYFDALDSMQFGRELDAFNTKMLIEVLSTTEADWIISVIASALELEEEAKQIYLIAESIRLEYIENTVSDLKLLFKNVSVLEGDKIKVNTIGNYLSRCMYGIDLYDVAKELLVRYKEKKAMFTESVS